jgi:hypothetical protein
VRCVESGEKGIEYLCILLVAFSERKKKVATNSSDFAVRSEGGRRRLTFDSPARFAQKALLLLPFSLLPSLTPTTALPHSPHLQTTPPPLLISLHLPLPEHFSNRVERQSEGCAS